MVGDSSMIVCSKDMTYAEPARTEIQAVAPQLLPLYEFLVKCHVSPFDQGGGNHRYVLKDLKQALILAGVRPVTWRFLHKLEPWLVRVLTKAGVLNHWPTQINRNVGLIASAGVAPVSPRVAELVLNASTVFPEGKWLELYAALTEIIFAEGCRRKAAGQDISLFAEEVRYILMWVGSIFLTDHHMPVGRWDPDWGVIYNQAITKLITSGEYPPRFENHYWHMYLAPFHCHGLYVIPLDCARLLLEEAETMAHCVYGYLNMCREDHSRIFSLRDHDGDRLATIELRRRGKDCWRLVQVRGVRNARPQQELLCIRVARETEQRFNLIWAGQVGGGVVADAAMGSGQHAA